MAHIQLPENVPGIASLFQYRTETAKPLMELAAVLLEDDSTLTKGEREIIAAFVSAGNECHY